MQRRKFARVWRCIRFLAVIDDPSDAPTPDFGFREGEIVRDLGEEEYRDLLGAVPWSWTDGSQ